MPGNPHQLRCPQLDVDSKKLGPWTITCIDKYRLHKYYRSKNGSKIKFPILPDQFVVIRSPAHNYEKKRSGKCSIIQISRKNEHMQLQYKVSYIV